MPSSFPDPDGSPSIRIVGLERSFACRPGQTVLQALAPEHHRRIPAGCHGGGCGVCRIRIIEGTYDTRGCSRAHITPDDEADRLSLACRTWPTSSLVVAPIGKLAGRISWRLGRTDTSINGILQERSS